MIVLERIAGIRSRCTDIEYKAGAVHSGDGCRVQSVLEAGLVQGYADIAHSGIASAVAAIYIVFQHIVFVRDVEADIFR